MIKLFNDVFFYYFVYSKDCSFCHKILYVFVTNHCSFSNYLFKFNTTIFPLCVCARMSTFQHYLLNCLLTSKFHIKKPSDEVEASEVIMLVTVNIKKKWSNRQFWNRKENKPESIRYSMKNKGVYGVALKKLELLCHLPPYTLHYNPSNR